MARDVMITGLWAEPKISSVYFYQSSLFNVSCLTSFGQLWFSSDPTVVMFSSANVCF